LRVGAGSAALAAVGDEGDPGAGDHYHVPVQKRLIEPPNREPGILPHRNIQDPDRKIVGEDLIDEILVREPLVGVILDIPADKTPANVLDQAVDDSRYSDVAHAESSFERGAEVPKTAAVENTSPETPSGQTRSAAGGGASLLALIRLFYRLAFGLHEGHALELRVGLCRLLAAPVAAAGTAGAGAGLLGRPGGLEVRRHVLVDLPQLPLRLPLIVNFLHYILFFFVFPVQLIKAHRHEPIL
jgi:hypothetical protein